MTHIQVEVCTDSIAATRNAQLGGASRVELCAALSEGGLTPSYGFIREARAALQIGLYVMIRPRTGDFVYSAEELRCMEADITMAKDLGANGVVFGVLTPEGDINVEAVKRLVEAASGIDVTFHRAIDVARDILGATETMCTIRGITRILTSGGEPTALAGVAVLKQMVDCAAGRLSIVVASSVTASNVASILSACGARECHASCRTDVASGSSFTKSNVKMNAAGVDEDKLRIASAAVVRQMCEAANSVA